MTVKLSESVKSDICTWYEENVFDTQEELANHFGISQRTLGRVLQEKGYKRPRELFIENQQNLLNVLNKHGIDSPEYLDRILSKASIENIDNYLRGLSLRQTLALLWNSATKDPDNNKHALPSAVRADKDDVNARFAG